MINRRAGVVQGTRDTVVRAPTPRTNDGAHAGTSFGIRDLVYWRAMPAIHQPFTRSPPCHGRSGRPRAGRPVGPGALAVLVALTLAPRLSRAQSTGIDATWGRWWPDSGATIYSVGYGRALFGPLGYRVGLTHVADHHSVADRTATGGDVSLTWGRRDGAGPYLIGSTALLLRHADGNLDAGWSGGLGYALPLLSFMSLGLEATYRTEDQDARGFWRLLPTDRRGLMLTARVGVGVLARRRGPTPRAPGFEPPSESDVAALSRERGASPEGAHLASAVVQTAIDAMGTPYAWGGSDSNGYDCSGLIQYAYGVHGILLPRMSRDQSRSGTLVERRLDALRPGDILGFSSQGEGVTHVGLYVGQGRFIHSTTGGVRLSSLLADEPDSSWWRHHWVVARRVLN